MANHQAAWRLRVPYRPRRRPRARNRRLSNDQATRRKRRKARLRGRGRRRGRYRKNSTMAEYTIELPKIPARMDIIADVGIISIEGAVGRSVGKPVGVVIVSGLVLSKLDLPESGMEIGVNGIERRLGGRIGAGEALVMKVLVFVIDDLGDRLEEIRSLQAGKSDGIVPD